MSEQTNDKRDLSKDLTEIFEKIKEVAPFISTSGESNDCILFIGSIDRGNGTELVSNVVGNGKAIRNALTVMAAKDPKFLAVLSIVVEAAQETQGFKKFGDILRDPEKTTIIEEHIKE